MADIVSTETRSRMMSNIRGRDTKPEMLVRRHLHGLGFRYRLSPRDLPGRPDLVLSRHKVAIFVHGCFWHGHDCRKGSANRKPKTNTEYWNNKINRNIERDARNARKLRKLGWRRIVLWACETANLPAMERKLLKALAR